MARRDQYIPVRKIEVVEALLAEPVIAAQSVAAKRFCQLLGSIYHFESFAGLERLRDDYYYFNPELGALHPLAKDALAARRDDLDRTLDEVLKKANYELISHKEVEEAHNQRHMLRVEVRASLEDYRQVNFYERGRHTETVEVRKWFGMRRKSYQTTVFDNVVLVVAVKSPEELTSPRQLKRLEESGFKPGTVLIKYFRNISAGDLHMLLPRVRVVMSVMDQLSIGLPAIAGAIPLLLNLLPALTVLSLVVGYYLGVAPDLDTETMVRSFGAFTGIAAVIGFILTQRMKYQKRSLQYQKQISDHFYFRNVSNNSGIFDTLVGSAEEQEFKEATLAYFFCSCPASRLIRVLWTAASRHGCGHASSSISISRSRTPSIKLERLGLLHRAQTGYIVPPLDQALVRLDALWDGFFTYANRPTVA